MAAGSKDKVLVLANPLRWRLYRQGAGHVILSPNPLWRRCLLLLMPTAIALPLFLGRGASWWGALAVSLPMGLLVSRTMRVRVEARDGVTRFNGREFDLTSAIPVVQERKGRVFLRVSVRPQRDRRVPTRYLLWESTDRAEVEKVLWDVLGATFAEESQSTDGPKKTYFTVTWKRAVADTQQLGDKPRA